MMMLAAYDLLYIFLSLLLFTVPAVFPSYKTSGAHFYVLPRALPLAQVRIEFQGAVPIVLFNIQRSIKEVKEQLP